MKKILILTFLVFISFDSMSQVTLPIKDNYYYEIHSALKNSDTDSSKVKSLNGLAGYHKFSRPDSGIYYSTKGFELAQKIDDKEQELRALENLATSYIALGNTITAYRVALEGLRKAEAYDSDMKGMFYRNLGMIMRRNQKFVESLEYYRKAKAEFYSTSNQNALLTAFATLGSMHSELGNIDSAFYYGYRAIAIAESLTNNPNDVAYSRMGDTHRNIQNIDSALYYYKYSNSIRIERRRSPAILLKIAQMYTLKEQLDSAFYYAEASLNLALANNLYEDVSESALFFSEFYENSDPSKAITYYKMVLDYQDSLDYMSNMTGFADLVNFDELQRKTELERANEAYQSRLRTTILIGSTLTLLIIAYFLFRNNRAKHKSKLQIEEAYNQLKSTQEQLIHSEKMASLGELTAGIAHEIKNPLNFVNNFAEVSNELLDEMNEELENGDIDEAKEISKDLKQNLEKINQHGKRADAIVRSMLQHSRTSTGEKELTDLNALCNEYVRLAYHGLRAKDKSFNAAFETTFDPELPKVKVVPQDIGRVLLNLINNAFQAVGEYAKTQLESYQPKVSISTKALENHIKIYIEDNGPGIPENVQNKIFQPFFTTKPTGEGTGLGLSLSYDIVKAHGGEIILENSGKGAIFKISFPIV